MHPRHTIFAALAATTLLAYANASTDVLPASWIVAGQSPSEYRAVVDNSGRHSGPGEKSLRHASGDGNSWATLMQQVSAENYRGKRIRFQANVKTADVSQWAGLWMRIDTPSKYNAAFYNSMDKPIKGTTDWQTRSVILDVPADASAVSFGVIHAGKGQVWIDALTLKPVGSDVAVSTMPKPKLSKAPSL